MNPTHGQKVTTDPESELKPIHEAVGLVTSDSLAAESLKNGSFGKGNPKAAASQQPSFSTTTNTTNTSAALKLDSAPDAQSRDVGDEETYSSAKGLGKESGVGPTYNTVGSSVKKDQGNVAPNAAYAHHAGTSKPKGANLTEDDDLKGETKFGEIGSKNDPSRLAEAKYAKRDALGGDVPTGDVARRGDSKFGQLSDERI